MARASNDAEARVDRRVDALHERISDLEQRIIAQQKRAATLDRQGIAHGKRITALETAARHDANLADIRETVTRIARSVVPPPEQAFDTDAGAPRERGANDTVGPESHIRQTRFRVL